MVTVYVNLYVLIPVFLNKKKIVVYGMLTLITVLFNAWLANYIDSLYFTYDQGSESIFIGSFISTLGVIGIAIGLKLMKSQVLQAEQKELLTREKTETELLYLKEQINPHFLFNVLNTIYVQTQINSADASQSVMMLSDLLRYQIYGTAQQEYVDLKEELSFLKNYISLEELRRENLKVSWSEKTDEQNFKIAPFILLPLIENAIKHSKMTDSSKEEIKIQYTLSDVDFNFSCTNTIGDLKPEIGGQGLANLLKRLDLIYGQSAKLTLEEKDAIFIAQLSIRKNEVYHN
jgi:LytS/YehU family sensor histidine kinase